MAKDDFNMSTEEYYKDFPRSMIPEEVRKQYPLLGTEDGNNFTGFNGAISIVDISSKNQVSVADGGGLRYSEGKPRYDLIPPEFMEALANHYAQGAKKYADRNWERGMSWGTCFRALMSHAWKWFRGEQFDEDPSMPGYKAPHTVAIAWNAIALYIYETRKIGTDDRPAAAPREKE